MKRILLVVVLALLLVTFGYPQKAKTVVAAGGFRSKLLVGDGQRVQTFELDSKLLARKTWFRVIIPGRYFDKGENGRIYPTLYLLHGLAGHFENWSNNTGLIDYSAGLNWIIVAPEGGDGWYTDSATVPNDKYESYIVQELIPEIDSRFRTIAERRGRVIAGLSMGGYGAIKFGLKYPDMFDVVGSFSGALDAPLRGQDHQNYRASIMSVFGPGGSSIRDENDVFTIIRRSPADRIGRLPYFYISCGTEDAVNFALNRDFAGLLIEKKIPHEYRELPGAHTWDFWNSQLQEFLRLVDTRLKP